MTGNINRNFKNLPHLLAMVGLCLVPTAAHALELVVPAVSNIHGSGHSSAPAPGAGGAGLLPPSITFFSGAGQIITFSSVTGLAVLNDGTGNNQNGPDGNGAAVASSNILAVGGISGIAGPGAGYLVGMFATDDEPAGSEPPSLDFITLGTDFLSLSPDINQTFFIGDGLTGTGAGTVQQFTVPANATRLFLGIADAPGYNGEVGAFGDNLGSFTAEFSGVQPIPEPAAPMLAAASGLLLARRRRR